MTARIRSFAPLLLVAWCLAPVVWGEDLTAEEVFAVGTSAGVRIDTRTDETHWTMPGAVEELYGEAPWTAPAVAGVYELSHTENGAPWTARFEVVGGNVEVVGDVDLATDAAWGADKTWLVVGTVVVKSGATLTVESGATIRQTFGGSILAKGGSVALNGAAVLPLDAAAVRTQASSVGVRIDTRTDETHWIEPGTVETLYGEAPWTAPAIAGVYELSHTENGAPWTAYYEVVGADVVVVGDVDLDADATWSADKTWLVSGTVVVKDGATLTVESGATILQPYGGSILAKGGTVTLNGAKVSSLSAGAVRTTATSSGVRLDTRTDETHWIEPGTVETLYGEAPWTAPADTGVYELSHTEGCAPWTARYEVVGENVEVVGDLDLAADATWSADKTWLVTGTVVVQSGTTLTVESGATIRQTFGGSILAKGGSVALNGAAVLPLDAAAVRTLASSAGVRIDTRTDEVHWTMPGSVEELYGEAPWTAPADAGVYELSHTENGAPWTARYEVVGENVEVVGDLDLAADATWGADKTWFVAGTVVVKPGATLTVESGAGIVFDIAGSIIKRGGAVVSDGAVFSNRSFDGKITYGEGVAQNVFVDTSAGTIQLASGPETVTFGTEWGEAPAESVAVYWDAPDGTRRTLVSEEGPAEGEFEWDPSEIGCHDLWHVAGEETMTARFIAPDPETTLVVRGGMIEGDLEWDAGKTILVGGDVTIPSGASLTIARGAVVKFMDGAGIVCSGTGRCIAEGVVFTHANDDTIGGDTLMDGDTPPETDRYVLTGVQIDESTQCRYYPDTALTLSGTIAANEVWRGWNVYRVTGNLTVASGATLTIEPGAVVKFDSGVSLTVSSGATLNAIGTRAKPIVFTSVRDDAHGGDTNGDGKKTSPQPGDWKKFSVNGTAVFDHAMILYASSGSGTEDAILVSGGTVFFNNSEMAFGQTYAVGVESGHFHATNSIIREYYCAFRHWPNDPIVNSVIYNCNRLSNNNGQKLYNCAIVGVNEAWDWSSGGGNTYCNCVFWNEPGFGLQSLPSSASAANGNVWGDPLFADPDNGDFKIAEGSPCVDAGLASVAPETDHFGQPRINAPDIGIYEAVPRSVAGDIDLVPKSVAADAEAVPGSWLTVTWEVANDGGAMANAQRRDTVSLVSAFGRTVTLGDKVLTQRIPAGGTVACSATFCVPAVAEGTWYPKVVVNSYQDIFEGALIANNALTAVDDVAVSLPPLDLAESASGVVNAGVPTVLKLTFPAGADNRMVKLDVPAGVTVTYGFGFMPQDTLKSGATTATADGALFRVPDDATDVYVVLESEATASYALSTESTKLAITGVSPATLPSSGTTTLTISGAGFGDECHVSLSSAGDNYRVPSITKDTSGNLVATVDCAALKAGTTYGLRVESGENTAELPGVVTVAKAEGKGHFWARLIIPDSVRQGRKVMCFVEYGNDGNADIPAPVMQIAVKGDARIRTMQGKVDSEVIQFVAAGSSFTAGVVMPGESCQYCFIMQTGANNALSLHSSIGQSTVPAPWSSAEGYANAISSAATRTGRRGQDPTDYATVLELARVTKTGEPNSSVFGFLTDGEGYPLRGGIVSLVRIGDTNAPAVASSDKFGFYSFDELAPGDYRVEAGMPFDSTQTVSIGPDADARVDMAAVQQNSLLVEVHGASEEVTLSLSSHDALPDYVVLGMDDNQYGVYGLQEDTVYVLAASDGDRQTTAWVSPSAEVPVWRVELSDVHTVSGRIETFKEAEAREGALLIRLAGSGMERFAWPSDDGRFGFSDIPDGVYRLDVCETTWGFIGTGMIAVTNDLSDIVLVPVAASSELSGRLECPEGVSGMTIQLVAGAGCVMTAELADSGEFLFGHVPSGPVLVSAYLGEERVWWARVEHGVSGKTNLGSIQVPSRAAGASRLPVARAAAKASVDWDLFDRIFESGVRKRSYELYLDALSFWGRHRPVEPPVEYRCSYNMSVYGIDKWDYQEFMEKLNTFGALSLQCSRMKTTAYGFKALHDGAQLFGDFYFLFTSQTYQASKAAIAFYEFSGTYMGLGFSAAEEEIMKGFQEDVSMIDALFAGISYGDTIASLTDSIRKLDRALRKARGRLSKNAQRLSNAAAVLTYLNLATDLVEVIRTGLNLGEAYADYKGAAEKMEIEYPKFKREFEEYKATVRDSWGRYHECDTKQPLWIPPLDARNPDVRRSIDPNEMVGPLGVGDPETERQLVPGEWATYTIYFENQTNATAAAQEVYVSEALSPHLDWSTFEMAEVAFGDQIDLGLAGRKNGSSDATMTGTNLIVRTSLALDETTGLATWYLRIVDPSTETGWPADILAGFLPPNDPETHCGEGHITYRVKVREDAVPGSRIDASATIVFDYNDPIITDPAWWNTVATVYKPTIDLGDGTTAEIELIVGQPYGELPTPKAKAGYSFGGWYTGPNGTGRKISADMIVEEGTTGLYAHWIANVPATYAVAFNANGGVGTMAAQQIAPGATAKLSANKFTKGGCVFLGWAKAKTGAVVYANGASVKDLAAAGKSVTLYAQWAVLKYSVKFNGNGGKLPKKKTMKALPMTYGASKKLPKNLFARKGYVFIGWSTKKKGLVEFPNKASVKNLTAKGGTVTLYAQWAKKSYKVAFDANGGKGKMATLAMTYGKAKKLTANKFTAPKGKKFAGWAKSKADAKASKVAYKNKKAVKNLVTTGKTVKLYAVWKKK